MFEYMFLIEEGLKTFRLELDRKTMGLLRKSDESPPAWADLSCQKCRNCPLSEEEHPHCPIAVNVVELVNFFRQVTSHEPVDVRVSTNERSYVKQTTMSNALNSLFGVYRVMAGCPILDKLLPMARFHLPVASTEKNVQGDRNAPRGAVLPRQAGGESGPGAATTIGHLPRHSDRQPEFRHTRSPRRGSRRQPEHHLSPRRIRKHDHRRRLHQVASHVLSNVHLLDRHGLTVSP